MNLLMFNSFALAVRDNGTYAPFSGDAWSFAGQVTLLGLGMVFAVLALLWGVLAIFKMIFVGKSPKEPKQPKPSKSKAPKKENVSQPDDVIAAVIAAGLQAYEADRVTNDTALIAILTAAVAAYREEEGTEGGFRVVSFKRASSRAWNAKK
jgi:sodium pump decarboxylase gamma subunit